MGGVVDGVDSSVGQGVYGPAGGIKLYKPRPPKPVHPLRESYPELFPAKAEAVVVTFSTDWCSPCKRQKAILKQYSSKYAILIVDAEEERWRALTRKWELGNAVPVTVVVERGEVAMVFRGLTPWREIEPYAKKAILNEK